MNGFINYTDPADDPQLQDMRRETEDLKERLSASDQAIKESLERQYDAAKELAAIHFRALRDMVSPATLAFVENYAAAKAKTINLRDKLEQCGW